MTVPGPADVGLAPVPLSSSYDNQRRALHRLPNSIHDHYPYPPRITIYDKSFQHGCI